MLDVEFYLITTIVVTNYENRAINQIKIEFIQLELLGIVSMFVRNYI